MSGTATNKVRLLANTKTRTDTGLEVVMSDMQPHSAYGSKLKKSFRPFVAGQEAQLNAAFDDMDLLRAFVEKHPEKLCELMSILCEIKEIEGSLSRVPENTLSIVELFDLKSFLLRSAKIAEIFEASTENLPERYSLADTSALLGILDPSGERLDTFYIYDAFSAELAEHRKEKRELERELRRVRKEIRSELEKEYGFRMTQKCELLVPKADKKLMEQVQGIAELRKQDEDYMSVVFEIVPDKRIYEIEAATEELNAKIEAEELKVCEELSARVAEYKEVLAANGEIIGNIDWDLAKIHYACSRNCVRPEIAEDHVIEIEDGRHLLVEAILKAKGGEYCPVSVSLLDGVTAITGANMGGKTVSIKMIGQIALLAQYAMYVPASRAKIGLSNFVQMLSGDSQNIQRGLSSFGSEMEELREILDNARDRSLIIIDEIASGTNPAEGLALTRSFIDYFSQKPYITVITTHFDYAAVGDNVQNLQVRGLSGADFAKLSREIKHAKRKERIEIIGKYMDYNLQPVDCAAQAPKEALKIAQILGVYEEIIDAAKGYLP